MYAIGIIVLEKYTPYQINDEKADIAVFFLIPMLCSILYFDIGSFFVILIASSIYMGCIEFKRY